MALRGLQRLMIIRNAAELCKFNNRKTVNIAAAGRTICRFYRSISGVYGFNPKINAQDVTKYRPKLDYANIDQALLRLIDAYRTYGHLAANLDPLELKNVTSTDSIPELDLNLFGLADNLEKDYDVSNLINFKNSSNNNSKNNQLKLTKILQILQKIYCNSIAVEFMHLETIEEREWFARTFEGYSNLQISKDDKLHLAKIMLECQNFDHFLGLKFATVKRYGGEGAESMMAFFDQIFTESCSTYDLKQVIICMPHRGRLNLLTTLLHYPAGIMFRKMKGKCEFPDNVKGLGDVLSHLSTSIDLKFGSHTVNVTMIPNPSHLEANNPVAVGKARARMQSLKSSDYVWPVGESMAGNIKVGDGVLCLQVHGDTSVTGQGIVAETSAMSSVPHYRIGGSLHLVVNNQVGFTTEAERGRSYNYCTDVAKMTSCPVIHVNGDFPEEVLKAARLAMDYRHVFRKDVWVDLICFRRWGHNELDDPTFTQPLMYDVIHSRKSVPDLYADSLEDKGLLDKEHRQHWVRDHNEKLMNEMKTCETVVPKANHLEKQWSGFIQAPSTVEIWDTGFDVNLLKEIGVKSVETSENFNLHPHLKKTHCDVRKKKLDEGSGLDWATCEALAFGSLLYQGYPVRISGQDVGRGTFSNRHVMLVDKQNDEIYIPLNYIHSEQSAFLEVANSILSEEAVLGFEYGMTIENPNRLVIWEAQFGDFFNGAQIIIDTFVTSGESKWLLQNSLVMLLPHGYDGAGPEHSSCRIERFLQLSDSKETSADGEDVNCNIAHPTTSAQYFHLLRRQMLRNYRKPLIVASPKILLRLPAASSNLQEMQPGTFFQPVLDDPMVKDSAKINKVIFCCGKHYYALEKFKQSQKLTNFAIVRLEALCPFPADQLQIIVKKYSGAKEFMWSQEEPRNMGPWFFIKPRFENLVGCLLNYAGRPELPIVASAISDHHQQQHDLVLRDTFKN